MPKNPVKKDVRARVWTMIVYPESAPKNWKEIIDNEHIQWCCVLHDKDVNPDGTKKKPHYHVVLVFQGKKSFSQINAICQKLNGPVPQKVQSTIGTMRYLIHKDNPEKHQYDVKDVEVHGGLDYLSYFETTASERALKKEIIDYINDYAIIHYIDLVNIAEDKSDRWFDYVTEHTFLFKNICDDNWRKIYHIVNEDIGSSRANMFIKAKEMAQKGIKQKEIADTLGINQSTVSRWIRQAQSQAKKSKKK